MNTIKRMWVHEGVSSSLGLSGRVSLCMRFSHNSSGLFLDDMGTFPASRDDPTLERHQILGLLDVDSLVTMYETIGAYLANRTTDAD